MWLYSRGVQPLLNNPGRPTQSACVESFNGKFRDECFNEQWFESLGPARLQRGT
ncbi:integrase core domain-containing protein [Caldimonas tepidiphila]|uniref:integrase core domain-containing protein n=1 Tax=Caldimonas tepidiphila TaxID=2315841 RepID=UPI003AF33AF3